MIFDRIAATLGGVVKDIQEATVATGSFLVDEISSIPAAFGAGYDHGLMSSSDPVVEEPTVITEEETVKQTSPFSAAAA